MNWFTYYAVVTSFSMSGSYELIKHPLAKARLFETNPDQVSQSTEREVSIDNLLVQIHLIINMILVDRPCVNPFRFFWFLIDRFRVQGLRFRV